jgi:hypothetical protein
MPQENFSTLASSERITAQLAAYTRSSQTVEDVGWNEVMYKNVNGTEYLFR